LDEIEKERVTLRRIAAHRFITLINRYFCSIHRPEFLDSIVGVLDSVNDFSIGCSIMEGFLQAKNTQLFFKRLTKVLKYSRLLSTCSQSAHKSDSCTKKYNQCLMNAILIRLYNRRRYLFLKDLKSGIFRVFHMSLAENSRVGPKIQLYSREALENFAGLKNRRMLNSAFVTLLKSWGNGKMLELRVLAGYKVMKLGLSLRKKSFLTLKYIMKYSSLFKMNVKMIQANWRKYLLRKKFFIFKDNIGKLQGKFNDQDQENHRNCAESPEKTLLEAMAKKDFTKRSNHANKKIETSGSVCKTSNRKRFLKYPKPSQEKNFYKADFIQLLVDEEIDIQQRPRPNVNCIEPETKERPSYGTRTS
jgi:hypothetical protein